MLNRLQRRFAHYALAFFVLCAVTTSSVARANECDTPAAESCACQSQNAQATSKAKARSAKHAEAAAQHKKAPRTVAKIER
jgi:hypothetical protein